MKQLIAFCLLVSLSACGKGDSAEAESRYLERKKAKQERFENGAYIAKEKQISATETVRVVILPSKISESFDVKCVLYTNTDFKVAQMQCPDITASDIDE